MNIKYFDLYILTIFITNAATAKLDPQGTQGMENKGNRMEPQLQEFPLNSATGENELGDDDLRPTILPYLEENVSFDEFSETTWDPITEAGVESQPDDDYNSTDVMSDELFENFTSPHGLFISGKQSCKCGIARGFEKIETAEADPFDDSRIVGGVPASIRELPWTAALLRRGSTRPFCGGTIINNYYILTASHCVDRQSASGIDVVVGQQNFPGSGGSRYNVASIKMHDAYDRRTVDNDIALLKLSRPIRLGGAIIPACLPAANTNDFSRFQATAAGWGTISQGGSLSRTLRKVEVPILTNDDCNTKSKYRGKITANQLCAGFLNTGGKDACQGDSGGPLIISNGSRKTLVGVVSWGYGCAQPKSPGVYTRVARYPRWILKNTGGASWCQG